MLITLKRKWLTEKSMIGELIIDKKFECYTLEDVIRKVKVLKETAIPEGKYEVIINYSNRFKKMLPLLLKVPKFEGVRIHTGNLATDTDGCILVGCKKGKDKIYESRKAMYNLMSKMLFALDRGKVYIEVVNGFNT